MEAQGFVNILFCRFNKDIFDGAPKYCFAYQLKISAVSLKSKPTIESASSLPAFQEFKPCKLLVSVVTYLCYSQGTGGSEGPLWARLAREKASAEDFQFS